MKSSIPLSFVTVMGSLWLSNGFGMELNELHRMKFVALYTFECLFTLHTTSIQPRRWNNVRVSTEMFFEDKWGRLSRLKIETYTSLHCISWKFSLFFTSIMNLNTLISMLQSMWHIKQCTNKQNHTIRAEWKAASKKFLFHSVFTFDFNLFSHKWTLSIPFSFCKQTKCVILYKLLIEKLFFSFELLITDHHITCRCIPLTAHSPYCVAAKWMRECVSFAFWTEKKIMRKIQIFVLDIFSHSLASAFFHLGIIYSLYHFRILLLFWLFLLLCVTTIKSGSKS